MKSRYGFTENISRALGKMVDLKGTMVPLKWATNSEAAE